MIEKNPYYKTIVQKSGGLIDGVTGIYMMRDIFEYRNQKQNI